MTDVVTPGSPTYDDVALALGLHSRPRIVRPRTAAQVIDALALADDNGITVRSGGHGGYEGVDGSLYLDLSAFCDIQVLDDGRVRIGSGALWGDVAEALASHDLALTSGDTYTVGVGGLTLGGGVGWMVRQHGLAIDSLLEAEVVLVSGDVVTTSAESEPELFWALRGGGGNFGIVTSFTFQAHPLVGIVFGSITLDPAQVAASLTGWRDVMRASPRDLNVTFLVVPGSSPQLMFCFGGDDLAETTRLTQPMRDLAGVTDSTIAVMRYPDILERMEKPEGVVTMVDNNTFANDFSDDLIHDLIAAHEQFGPAVLMIRYVGGALNEVPVDATAWAHRDAEVLIISAAFLEKEDAAEDARIRGLWATITDRTTGLYGNFSPTRSDAVTALMYPPETLARLRAAKARYDPENVLRQNHNVVVTEPDREPID